MERLFPRASISATSNRGKVSKLYIQNRKLEAKQTEDTYVKDSNYNISLFQTCNIF